MPRKKPRRQLGRAQPVEPEDPGPEDGGEVVAVSAHYSGPLPLPRHFEGFERVLPGAAELIMQMAESEGRHRRWRRDADTAIRFFPALAAVGFAGYRVIWHDDAVTGAIVLAAGLLAAAMRR